MDIRELPGNDAWDYGISLDKHVLYSVPVGENAQGYMQFETTRTAIGEAVFQLKYRDDYDLVDFLAESVAQAIQNVPVDVVLPMPASRQRTRQPVHAVAERVAQLLELEYCDQTLIKHSSTVAMKDLATYEERCAALQGCFVTHDKLHPCNILLLDDLFDTGASLEAACTALRGYASIRSIAVVTLTRRH